jgi:hypothetical protein
LTVADDLLKNDGKKFLEMMERLAERRMQREEEESAMDRGEYYDDDEDEDEDEYEEDGEEVKNYFVLRVTKIFFLRMNYINEILFIG